MYRDNSVYRRGRPSPVRVRGRVAIRRSGSGVLQPESSTRPAELGSAPCRSMLELRQSAWAPRAALSAGRAIAQSMAVQRRDRAGRSADLIFQAARRDWRRGIRLPLALIVVAIALLALPVWLFTPYGGFGAGLVLGVILGMAAWAWDQPP